MGTFLTKHIFAAVYLVLLTISRKKYQDLFPLTMRFSIRLF